MEPHERATATKPRAATGWLWRHADCTEHNACGSHPNKEVGHDATEGNDKTG